MAPTKKKLEGLVEETLRVCGKRKLKVNDAKSKVKRYAREGIKVQGTVRSFLKAKTMS